jgi:hypothetical protein
MPKRCAASLGHARPHELLCTHAYPHVPLHACTCVYGGGHWTRVKTLWNLNPPWTLKPAAWEQTPNITDEGNKFVTFYRIVELPAIAAIDPLTGATVRQWNGFVEPDRCAEAVAAEVAVGNKG